MYFWRVAFWKTTHITPHQKQSIRADREHITPVKIEALANDNSF
jgi:hypothetical protein